MKIKQRDVFQTLFARILSRDTPADAITCAKKKQIFTQPLEALVKFREPELDGGLWLLTSDLRKSHNKFYVFHAGRGEICHNQSHYCETEIILFLMNCLQIESEI